LPFPVEKLQDLGMAPRLSAIFRGAERGGEGEASHDDGLETVLVEYVEAARKAWPDLDVDA
jgi:hypothetical protein